MIVKVQLSMPGKGMVLIYDKERKHLYEGRATREIKALMERGSKFSHEGGYKAFFHATLEKDPKHPDGIRFALGSQAPWQEW